MRTIFNFLGPLTNPAGAERQLLGVSDRRYQETIAEALVGLGCEHALVVTADDGLDELSISARTRVIEVAEGGTEEWFVEPGEFGLGPAELDAGRRRRARRRTPPRRVPSSTARAGRAAISSCSTPARRSYVGGRRGRLGAGVEQAPEAVDSGAAREVLDRLVATTDASSARPPLIRLRSGPQRGNDRAARLRGPRRGRGAPRAGTRRQTSSPAYPRGRRTGPSARRWCAPASR